MSKGSGHLSREPAAGAPPTVVIALALEEPPRVRWVCSRESDWIASHPALMDLLERGLELERAAA